MNINHIGMGMMVAGAGMLATSFMPTGTGVNIMPPGTPQGAALIGGMGLAAIGGALTLVQPPK